MAARHWRCPWLPWQMKWDPLGQWDRWGYHFNQHPIKLYYVINTNQQLNTLRIVRFQRNKSLPHFYVGLVPFQVQDWVILSRMFWVQGIYSGCSTAMVASWLRPRGLLERLGPVRFCTHNARRSDSKYEIGVQYVFDISETFRNHLPHLQQFSKMKSLAQSTGWTLPQHTAKYNI